MKKKQPVSIWGIEFDALIEEQKSYSSSIPVYPIERGFPVSDTIINEPFVLQMSLFISNTPVTWLHRHGSNIDRVNRICKMIEKKWFEKKLTKIVTSDTIYTDMGITSISIKKSSDIGYAREVSITAQKVYVTQKKTADIPKHILKSGKSMANAGKASTSKTSNKKGTSASSSKTRKDVGEKGSDPKIQNSGGSKKKKSGSKGNEQAKKSHSMLYGTAKGFGLL